MSPADPIPPRPSGLTTSEATARLETYGQNRLPIVRGPGVWRQLAGQLFHFFALLLWVAGGLAFVAGLPELGFAIFGVILLNGLFAFIQEHRAERAGERLREIVPRRATVVRDGQHREIEAVDLVPGDLVVLAGGDRVSADMTAVEAHSLRIDESILTGESVAVDKGRGDAIYSGTFVVEGEGLAVIDATAAATRLASVAALTTQVRRHVTPLAREIRRLVRTTTLIAVGVGVAFVVASAALGFDLQSGLVFGVGVMVALVPEALLPTVTLSLAIGAQRMAARHALIRRLEAVETLGSTTFLCTDKTGTLTQNRMAVVEVWTPLGTAKITGIGYEPEGEVSAPSSDVEASVRDVAVAARRCSTGQAVLQGSAWVAVGDPMEAAIDAFARRAGAAVDEAMTLDPETSRFPFDARRRRMSVMTAKRVYVKGAPDAVFPVCVNASQLAFRAVEAMSSRGLRVLAVATGQVPAEAGSEASSVERDLELAGLIGLEDPPRPSAAASVAACRAAGVHIALVTGDHPSTAKAIADEVGIYLPGAPVLTGRNLPDDDALLAALVDRDGAVISRVTPEDKLRIAGALRSRGHVVAMTGDGVNDGPALREADIGVAMGASGTDVAREAADVVLLDDDLATIVAAIGQGRATFINARRFLTYHLTDNVAEITPFLIWALSGNRIPLALGVLQILALDLGTDTMSATALGAEPSHRDVSEQPPSRGRLLDRKVAFRAFGLLGPVEAAAEMAAFFAVFLAAGWRPGESFPESALASASGAAFATVVLAQTANAFACRSTTRPAWRLPFLSNKLLIGAALIELAIAAAFLFVPAVAEVLGHVSPPGAGWVIALASIPLLLGADAMHKALRRSGR
ncbi:MAG TPA: cation-transporting P-type ATPase [Acidimicrobiia bacterium]|nr:cation-transporting P-type ATPase [Acidimicrobiia bacterium]